MTAAQPLTATGPATGTDAVIEVEDLAKDYPAKGGERVHALTGVSFRVRRGEIFGLLGPNGAGKSTTVRLMATLAAPTAGSARIAGHDTATDGEAVRRSIGVALQETGLAELMTAREALCQTGRLWGMATGAADARATELLELIGLEEAADRLVKTFSGGMKRRLDLALALVHRPEVLFLDEPTNGLDPVARRRVWDQVRALRDAGTTVLLTTQYLEEADQLADRVAVIDGGRIVAQGTPDELKRAHGADTVELVLADEEAARSLAADVLVEGKPGTASGPRIAYAVRNPDSAVPELLLTLHTRSVRHHGLRISRPSLDDVFIALTGHGIAPETSTEPDPGDQTAPTAERLRSLTAAATAPGRDAAPGSRAAAPPLTQTWLLLRRLLREALRNPGATAPNLMIGTFFLFVYDGLLGGSPAAQASGGGNYANFLLPTILLFTSLSGGAAGLTLVQDIEAGHLKRQLTMPLSRTALMASFTAIGAIMVLAQAVIVTLLSLTLGMSPETGPAGLLAVFGLALLWGLGIAGYSAATAVITGNAAAAQAATLIFFPLLFISPALMPASELKGWIEVASAANPATYLLESMRGLLNDGWDAGQLAVGVGVGTGFAALMLAWAATAVKRGMSRA
ncbi:ATP-binding cassette domain-containing protein [Streptomyces sp. NPDC051018]|uniref:ATP-binding cassette domain-containing protein n=1 Tax=Streptomyces sp. NPDC051018 TaxID=3365639 RepID=UPI00378E68AB